MCPARNRCQVTVTYDGKNPKLWKIDGVAPRPSSPLPALSFFPGFLVVAIPLPAPGLSPAPSSPHLSTPWVHPVCCLGNPPPHVTGSSGRLAPGAERETKQLGVGSSSQVNPHPHPNSKRVGWDSLGELEQGAEARSCWEWHSWQPLEGLKQGQLLP